MKSYKHSIEHFKKNKSTSEDISSRIFSIYPAFIFRKLNNYDIEFEIKNRVAKKFNTPITNILICGSAQIGESIYKNSIFSSQSSDLDLAIIDAGLYIELSEIVRRTTNNFSDFTKFNRDLMHYEAFTTNYYKGYAHIFTLPACDFKTEISKFFNLLSQDYKNEFKYISATIYASLKSFESKQLDLINIT